MSLAVINIITQKVRLSLPGSEQQYHSCHDVAQAENCRNRKNFHNKLSVTLAAFKGESSRVKVTHGLPKVTLAFISFPRELSGKTIRGHLFSPGPSISSFLSPVPTMLGTGVHRPRTKLCLYQDDFFFLRPIEFLLR